MQNRIVHTKVSTLKRGFQRKAENEMRLWNYARLHNWKWIGPKRFPEICKYFNRSEKTIKRWMNKLCEIRWAHYVQNDIYIHSESKIQELEGLTTQFKQRSVRLTKETNTIPHYYQTIVMHTGRKLLARYAPSKARSTATIDMACRLIAKELGHSPRWVSTMNRVAKFNGLLLFCRYDLPLPSLTKLEAQTAGDRQCLYLSGGIYYKRQPLHFTLGRKELQKCGYSYPSFGGLS